MYHGPVKHRGRISAKEGLILQVSRPRNNIFQSWSSSHLIKATLIRYCHVMYRQQPTKRWHKYLHIEQGFYSWHIDNIFSFTSSSVQMTFLCNVIPLQSLRFPEGCGSQILRQLTHEGGKAVSPTHRPPLPPRKYSWYSFLLEAESIPGP